MRYEVLLTKRAIHDLEIATEMIRSVVPDFADRWKRDFLIGMQALQTQPESRSLAPEAVEFKIPIYQFFYRTKSRFANRVLYCIVGNEVRILAVRRPGQDLVKLDELTP